MSDIEAFSPLLPSLPHLLLLVSYPGERNLRFFLEDLTYSEDMHHPVIDLEPLNLIDNHASLDKVDLSNMKEASMSSLMMSYS
jgi:hypothetical protein